jgi:hypothetical protein
MELQVSDNDQVASHQTPDMSRPPNNRIQTRGGYSLGEAAAHTLVFAFRTGEGPRDEQIANQDVCELPADVATLLSMDGVLEAINTACGSDIDFGSVDFVSSSALAAAIPILRVYATSDCAIV